MKCEMLEHWISSRLHGLLMTDISGTKDAYILLLYIYFLKHFKVMSRARMTGG